MSFHVVIGNELAKVSWSFPESGLLAERQKVILERSGSRVDTTAKADGAHRQWNSSSVSVLLGRWGVSVPG